MPVMDLRNIVYSKLTENETAGTSTYATGKVGPKAVKVDTKLNIADSPYYAEGGVSERERKFIDGTMTFDVDDISDQMRQDLLDNKTTTETVNTEEVTVLHSNEEDNAGYYGWGFYVTKKKNGARQYRAIFYTKVQFAEPDDSAETAGQQINWQTPKIEGKIMRRFDGEWKMEITTNDKATAITWLKSKANIAAA